MKLALILATLALSAPLAHAEKKTRIINLNGPRESVSNVVLPPLAHAKGLPQISTAGEGKVRCVTAGKEGWCDVPPTRIGWVDSAKLDAGSTEIARVKTRPDAQAPQARQQMMTNLRDACAKVKADKHLAMVVTDPLAAEPGDEVTAEVLKLWNAADEAGVAQENARLTARVAQLEADKAALTKPVAPSVPPAPPIQPARVAKK